MRTRPLLSAGACLGVLAVAVTATGADAATVTQGQAQAVLVKVVPYVGVPGVNASIGLSTAQVSGDSAQSSAATADFGLIGQLAGAGVPNFDALPPIDLPQPATADSQKQPIADSDPISVPGAPTAGSGPSFTAAHQHAEATKGRSDGVATGPGLDIPGLITVTGGRSEARTDATHSISDVTIGSISLAGGLVVLADLHWTASQVAKAPGVATFSLGSLTIAGQALPVAAPDQLAAGLEAARTALAPLGLALSIPTHTADASGAVVAPLVLQVRNPETIATQTQQITAQTTPVLAPVIAQLLASMPNAAASSLVINALLGGIGGQSGGRLELGGVAARSAPLLLTADGVLAPLPQIPPATAGTAATPPLAGLIAANDPALAPPAVVGAAPVSVAQRPAAYRLPGGGSPQHGALVALGLVVAALAAQAGADRLRALLRGGR
ncbi:MAG TPA: hypothetical protein VGL04_00055 [Sporichthyaceae bacterium]|jgi:hypothetical protein